MRSSKPYRVVHSAIAPSRDQRVRQVSDRSHDNMWV